MVGFLSPSARGSAAEEALDAGEARPETAAPELHGLDELNGEKSDADEANFSTRLADDGYDGYDGGDDAPISRGVEEDAAAESAIDDGRAGTEKLVGEGGGCGEVVE